MNAMRLPSGDQAGYSASISVSRRRWVPSGLTTYSWGRRSRSELKAIIEPSGDQAGPQSFARFLVRFRCPEPSAFIT